jgi:arylsulfatase A-like enzyme
VKNRRPASQTVNRVIAHIKQGLKKEFYWIHFFDAHMPYQAPRRFLSKHYERSHEGLNTVYEEIKSRGLFVNEGVRSVLSSRKSLNYYLAAYRGALEYVDHEIGRLVKFLKENRMWDKSLFVVTSDHAENLAENGVFFDHAKLFDETTKIPLYWRDPTINGGKEINDLVQHVDIYPSLLEKLDIEVSSPIRGISLYSSIAEAPKIGHKFVFTEHAKKYQYTIRTEKWQYLWKNQKIALPKDLDLEDNFLIDRNNLEKAGNYKNLAFQFPLICRELRNVGEALLSSPVKEESESYPVSKGIKETLKSWGYL